MHVLKQHFMTVVNCILDKIDANIDKRNLKVNANMTFLQSRKMKNVKVVGLCTIWVEAGCKMGNILLIKKILSLTNFQSLKSSLAEEILHLNLR